jgi:aminocarboxymuconate-semialdehyde decarboxylase
MFYGDTAVNGSAAAIRCGLDFFGPKRVMFGTDCPFDPQGGPLFIRESIKAIDSLKLPRGERDGIYFGNALRMLRMKAPAAGPARKRRRA